MSSEAMNFDGLVQVIQQTHSSFAGQASKAVNISPTLRNGFIGHHSVEFEWTAQTGPAMATGCSMRCRGHCAAGKSAIRTGASSTATCASTPAIRRSCGQRPHHSWRASTWRPLTRQIRRPSYIGSTDIHHRLR